LKKWLELNDIKIIMNNIKSVENWIEFTDEKIKNSWIEFHNNNTHLRIVSKNFNLKINRNN
jgi:hypothetical protein